MKKNNVDAYRVKFCSVVIQPKVAAEYWMQENSDKEIETKLMESAFPLHTEIIQALANLSVETINKTKFIKPVSWAFGTETSVKTRIPHYQIYLKFDKLVRKSIIYEELVNALGVSRVHIVTDKVFNENYKNYCLKTSSNFTFESSYYWNVKLSSENIQLLENNLVKLRKNLESIMYNYFTGQKLLKKMALSEPDDRTGLWLADVIGGTGKTAFFQTIVDDPEAQGCYLRVSDGVERLSAKLRKKITARLEANRGYPRWIWVNFGRTVGEDALKAFSDFGEQILDGMLDDNFGNTATEDFMALPYVNLIVTANTPPNLKQLTGDRIKLLTLFPIYSDPDKGILEDSIIIPIFVEVQVRVQKSTMRNFLEYRYKVRPQSMEYIINNFSKFEYYDDLLENYMKYLSFTETEQYRHQLYQSKLETDWIAAAPKDIQTDVYRVYVDACIHSSTVTGPGSGSLFIQASSFKRSTPKVYEYQSQPSERENIWDKTFGEN